MPILDPFRFLAVYWPDVILYRQQQEIVRSVMDNDETYVPAGNALGKDFVAGFIALWWFLSRRPARVVTTSVKADQLVDVLWGEIRRFIQTAAAPLPIKVNHLKLRQVTAKGRIIPNAELVGQVSNTQEGLLGRHSTAGFKPIQNDIPRTLVIFDEASGIDDLTYQSTQTWAHRKLIIGNPFPCENFFKRGVKAGDLKRKRGGGYHRKVIKIKAVDSPNIQYALAEIALGKDPTNKVFVPGVKTYDKYEQDRALWDDVLQCVGLDAEFYEGAEVLLFPPQWLNEAERCALDLIGMSRQADAMGIDPGEGGADTSWAIIDKHGLIKLISKKTPDTSFIVNDTIALINQYNIPHEKVTIDRGGGGLQVADQLRERGYDVQTVGFGEAVMKPPHIGIELLEAQVESREERYVYKNRRAQMYGELRNLLDPSLHVDSATGKSKVFAIPSQYNELRRQLAPIPLLRDREGRLFLPPKNKASGEGRTRQKTLTELIGRSPDDADALVLAVHGMLSESMLFTVGAFT